LEDETDLLVEEVDEIAIGTIQSSVVDTKIETSGAKSFKFSSKMLTNSAKSSLERQIRKDLRQNYHHYQSLLVLSPVKQPALQPNQGQSSKASVIDKANIAKRINNIVSSNGFHKRNANALGTARSLNREMQDAKATVASAPYENINTNVLSSINNTNDSLTLSGSQRIEAIASQVKSKKAHSPEILSSNHQNNVLTSNFIQVKNQNQQRNQQKVKKQQDKVRVIIQSSQA
jgi:hypothetical protein